MSNSDRRPYKTSTLLDQEFLNFCQDNLECKLELIVDIETPSGFIRASDRPKYVISGGAGIFYENRMKFPVISRTVGEWLSTQIEFSVLKLTLNNADGKFNDLLPDGLNYDGFIGRSVEVKLGLRDVGSTFTTIFKGTISDVGGFARDISAINITARDNYDKLDVKFPNTVLSAASFPNIQDDVVGTLVPVIYGDWTVAGNPLSSNASVPAFVLNGADPNVNGTISNTNDVELIISENDLKSLSSSDVWVKKGDNYFNLSPLDITVGIGNRFVDIAQDTGNSTIEGGANYIFEESDEYFVKCIGKDLAGFDDNIVEQARDILKTYAGVLVSEFDSNWDTFRSKASPSESSIATIRCRIWIQDPQSVLAFVLSLLEQVRLEAFIDRNLMLKISSLHLDDFSSSPSFKVTNFDVVEKSFRPTTPVRNTFNRAQAVYSFLPDSNENSKQTSFYRNNAAVAQMNKVIDKRIVFPNLYIESDVESQLKEILKISSSGLEHIDCELTWRALLLDIGDFVSLDVKIGSTIYENVPCLIRDLGYDPQGIKIPVRLWSTQLLPFPGYTGVTGSVGGSSANIVQET